MSKSYDGQWFPLELNVYIGVVVEFVYDIFVCWDMHLGIPYQVKAYVNLNKLSSIGLFVDHS